MGRTLLPCSPAFYRCGTVPDSNSLRDSSWAKSPMVAGRLCPWQWELVHVTFHILVVIWKQRAVVGTRKLPASNPAHSDSSLPARLLLPKHSHYLGSECSDSSLWGTFYLQTTAVSLSPDCLRCESMACVFIPSYCPGLRKWRVVTLA